MYVLPPPTLFTTNVLPPTHTLHHHSPAPLPPLVMFSSSSWLGAAHVLRLPLAPRAQPWSQPMVAVAVAVAAAYHANRLARVAHHASLARLRCAACAHVLASPTTPPVPASCALRARVLRLPLAPLAPHMTAVRPARRDVCILRHLQASVVRVCRTDGHVLVVIVAWRSACSATASGASGAAVVAADGRSRSRSRSRLPCQSPRPRCPPRLPCPPPVCCVRACSSVAHHASCARLLCAACACSATAPGASGAAHDGGAPGAPRCMHPSPPYNIERALWRRPISALHLRNGFFL